MGSGLDSKNENSFSSDGIQESEKYLYGFIPKMMGFSQSN
jgi:hypothetical protein